MRLSEGRGPGSTPGEGIGSIPASVSGARRCSKPQGRVRFPGGGWRRHLSSECDGFAYDSAKVEDQVQFLARTLRSTTLEPDGQATGCNPVQVGSTPTGVFLGRRSPSTARSGQ